MTANPWLERRVFHWADQGGAREGPSNTLHAMGRAIEVGAHRLEVDVHVIKDGHIVVADDDELRRVTGADGRISTSTSRPSTPPTSGFPDRLRSRGARRGVQPPKLRPGTGRPHLRIRTLQEVPDTFRAWR